MITLFRANEICAFEDLRSRMSDHIRALPQQLSFIGTPLKIMRLELPCEPIDILSWLHNNHDLNDKLYWSDRDNAFETGGIGIGLVVTGSGPDLIERIEQHLSGDNPHLKFYGGMCFPQKDPGAEWQKLGACRFVAPKFEFYKSEGYCWFAYNVPIKDVTPEFIAEDIKALEKIDFAKETTYRKVPVVTARHDSPDEKKWKEVFKSLSAEGKKSRFDKIVLARKTTFDFDMDIRPMALIKHLKDMSPGCFHFCFQPAANYGFLGASPERLFKRGFDTLATEAIAGTCPRGQTEEEDKHLAEELLNSTKNKHEHAFVVDHLREKLEQLCRSIDTQGQTEVLKLDNGQHLITRFTGTLKADTGNGDILEALHPTPAVAGCPKEEALAAIESLEPFSRGWYAGPVGYIGAEAVEFAVAIRCGLVDKSTLSLYAGAGIVEGSLTEDEWQEIESKIGSFIKVFNKNVDR